MRKVVGKALFFIFIFSFLYYVIWLVYSFVVYFKGIDSGWLIPSISSHKIIYGWQAFGEAIGMCFVYTLYVFWFIPLYQLIYIASSIILRLIKKQNST